LSDLQSEEPVLSCPVRGCGVPLPWTDKSLRCAGGHAFDRARSGYCNLLQPQDKRSKHPGDSRDSVLARRRSWERGMGRALVEGMVEYLSSRTLRGGRLLDVGSGDGFLLHELACRLGLEGWGLDISTPAAEAAARAFPSERWIVANGDRRMPFLDRSFSLVSSITSRRNAPEFRRVLRDDGLLVLVVPAPDDLNELRHAVLGEALEKDRASSARTSLHEHFEVDCELSVRSKHELDAEGLADLLRGSYQGARHAAQERFRSVERMEVTVSYQVLALRPKP